MNPLNTLDDHLRNLIDKIVDLEISQIEDLIKEYEKNNTRLGAFDKHIEFCKNEIESRNLS